MLSPGWLEVAGVLQTPATSIILCLYFNCRDISTTVPIGLRPIFGEFLYFAHLSVFTSIVKSTILVVTLK